MMKIYKSISLVVLISLVSIFGYAKDGETNIKIRGNLLTPPPCKVNSGELIEVDFGQVSIKSVKGLEKKEKVNYQIQCSENKNNWRMYLTIDGAKSQFDKDGLQTNIGNLAVKFQLGDLLLELGKKYPINPDSPGILWAVLVKDGNSELKTGSFWANGTLQVEYQ